MVADVSLTNVKRCPRCAQTKALGRVASALNDAEHEGRAVLGHEVSKYLADIIICAARFAHGLVDIESAVSARVAEKFPFTPPQSGAEREGQP